MIRFPCHCRFIFEAQDEMAGSLIQCPKCGRLNDVPTLSDLVSIEGDGTLKVEQTRPDTPAEQARRLAELERIWSPTDEFGRRTNNKNTIDRVLRAGEPAGSSPTGEIPLKDDARPRPPALKYDPVTGELVRPLDVRESPPAPQAIPIAARALTYAGGGPGAGSVRRVLMDLFQPTNIFVLALVFMTHLFLQVTTIAGLIFSIIAYLMMSLIGALIMAHYGCVVDETGPDGHDELPRPLRHLDWHDDLWGPFSRVFLAVGWCYLVPAMALFMDLPATVRLVIAAAGAILGTLVFPAMLLTSTTSGTILNLRPDRVWGVIKACGASYLVAVLFWCVAGGTYLLGILGSMFALLLMFGLDVPQWMQITFHWAVMYPILVTGIYLAHGFCWYLGLLYRRYHAEFPWVFQRHEYRNETAIPPPREKRGFAPVSLLPATSEAADRARRQQAALPPQPPIAPRPVQLINPADELPPPPHNGGHRRRF